MGEGGEKGKGTNHCRVILSPKSLTGDKSRWIFSFFTATFQLLSHSVLCVCSFCLHCFIVGYCCCYCTIPVVCRPLAMVTFLRAHSPTSCFFSLSFFGPAISTLSLFKSDEEESKNFVSQMLSPSSYFPILKVIVQ